MRRLIAITSGALLAGALTGAASPASAAAAPTATKLSIFLNPVPGVVGDKVVVIGRLEEYRRGDWHGLGNKAVRLSIADPNGHELLYLSTVTTNNDGTYTQTYRAPRSGGWHAGFQPALGDAHRGSAAQSSWLNLVYRTRITGYSAKPGTLPLGSRLKVKGRAYKLGVPSAFPLAGAKVYLFWSPNGQQWHWQASTTTSRAGDFAFSRVSRADGYWTASLPAAGDHLATGTSATWVDVKFRTRLTLNAKPKPVRRGHAVTIKGLLRYVNARGQLVPMGGRTVRIYFRARGTRRVILIGAVRTNRSGGYTFKFKPARGGGYRAGWDAVGTWLSSRSSWDFVGVRR